MIRRTADTITRLTLAHGRRPRVAIVGASPIGGMVATALLEQFGCTPVIVTRRANHVLALLRQDEPVDLAIIDVSLPNIDGIVAVQLIRALGTRGTLPVVALTEGRRRSGRPALRAAGFAGAVAKPYSPRELFSAMHHALFGADGRRGARRTRAPSRSARRGAAAARR